MESKNTDSGRSLLKSGSILSLLTLVSRVFGLIREMVKAALLGTSALSDAFTVAFMIPNLLRRLFAEGSIAVAFIPTFKDYELAGDKAKMREFLSATFTMLTFLVTVTVAIGILVTPLIIPLFGLAAPDETILLTRIMFPYLALTALAAFFQGILNGVNIFAPTGIAPILLNVAIIICSYALGSVTGNPARAMAVGVIVGGLLQAFVQLPSVLRNGFRFPFISLGSAFTNPGTKQVLRLIGPTIIGMAAYQLNDLVSTALAGRAGEGVVSSLQYSLRLQELILGIFAVSLGTVLLPNLAGHAKSARWEEFNDRLVQAIEIIALITVPISFFFIVEGETLIRLLFQTRSFNETSVSLTKIAFMFHTGGLFFIALNRILAPAFYAQSDSKSPTIAGIASFAMNMLLAALLVGPMKGGGVALALSVASAVNTVLLLVFLKRNPMIQVARAIRSASLYALKLAAFSIIACIPLWLLKEPILALFSGHGRLVSAGIPLVIGAFVFGIVGVLLLCVTGDPQTKAMGRLFSRRK